MKRFFGFFHFLLMSSLTFGQGQKNNISSTPGQTSFYAELGGPGILFSANIDRRFKASTLGWGFRAGLGFVTADEQKIVNGNYEYNPASVVTVPLQINYIFGQYDSPHAFEVGAGLTYVGRKLDIMNFYDDRKSNLFGSFSFMYRRQPVKGGFSWRIGFTPLVAQGYIQPSGAVSVGYNF
jgi:hypothetical protein